MRLVLTALLGGVFLAAQGRVRPPEDLGCDRNQLTSFAGDVVEYTRTGATMRLRVKTDADTDERFTLHFSKAKTAEWWMRIGGGKFSASDWSKVESARGKLRPGVKVIVWKCEGAANPVVDWRLPAE